MPERATTTITLSRSDDTVQLATRRLQRANIRFVEALVPEVRNVEITGSTDPNAPKFIAHPLDFYERDLATGAILKNNNGVERIRANALNNAVETLMRRYHRDVINAAIAREKRAETEAAIAVEIGNDQD